LAWHVQTICVRLYLPIMLSAMLRLAFIETAGCCTAARIAGAWKAKTDELRVVLRLPTRETWREHTWWGGETWAGVVRSDWRGRGQAYEVAGRAAPASAAGTLPAT
jgi:hypothetical protein